MGRRAARGIHIHLSTNDLHPKKEAVGFHTLRWLFYRGHPSPFFSAAHLFCPTAAPASKQSSRAGDLSDKPSTESGRDTYLANAAGVVAARREGGGGDAARAPTA